MYASGLSSLICRAGALTHPSKPNSQAERRYPRQAHVALTQGIESPREE